jgi:N utilization substance protein B
MGKRREGRTRAVQFLYQIDAHPTDDTKRALDEFWALTETEGPLRDYAADLIHGVLQHRDELDKKIAGYAQNWEFDRMALVDRNILRLALYEMTYRDDIPPVASINEAIEIAKSLSTVDSSRFVNGILDRAKKDLARPAR